MFHVLIVDDSLSEQRLIAGLLRKSGAFAFRFAARGEQALERIAQRQPDLIVTDLLMPGIDGLQLTRLIRQQYPQIPVVLVTGHGSESLAVEALEQGAGSYVPKAEISQRLSATVQQVLSRAHVLRLRQQLACRVSELTCSLVLENELALVGPLVDYLQQQMAGIGCCDANGQLQVGVALEEILRDAMLQNLELSPAERTDTLRNGQISADLSKRLKGTAAWDRKLTVRATLSRAGAQFVIGVEVAGGLAHYESSGDERQAARNRSAFLVRSLLEEVAVNPPGTEVHLFKWGDRVVRAIRDRFASPQLGDDLFSAFVRRRHPPRPPS